MNSLSPIYYGGELKGNEQDALKCEFLFLRLDVLVWIPPDAGPETKIRCHWFIWEVQGTLAGNGEVIRRIWSIPDVLG